MHRVGFATLQYQGSAELPLAEGEQFLLPAHACNRFGVCLYSDLQASLDDPHSRAIRIPAGELFHLPADEELGI